MQESQPAPLDGGGVVGLPKGKRISRDRAREDRDDAARHTDRGTVGTKGQSIDLAADRRIAPCSPEAGDRVGDELSLQAASTRVASSSPGSGDSASSPLKLKTLWFSDPPVRPLTRSGRYLRS